MDGGCQRQRLALSMRGSAGNMKRNTVRKVVIPAAGLGTRFLPLTKAQPKEMLPVVDKPVIQYVVEEAVRSGLDDIIIITGRNKRAIEDHFDRCPELEQLVKNNSDPTYYKYLNELSHYPNIHFIRQPEQKGLGDAILLAEQHCNEEPFVVILGDTITIEPPGLPTCTRQMISMYEKYQRSIIAVEPVPDHKIQDYGIIDGELLEPNVYQINTIIEKPTLENAPSNIGAIGCYLFTPDIFDHIRTTKPGSGGEIQLTDAIRKLHSPLGLITECIRYDIGDKMGWMKAFIQLTLQHPEFRNDLAAFMHEILGENK